MSARSPGQTSGTLDTPAQLKAAAAHAGLGLSDEEATGLIVYGTLLEQWNRHINLTASRGLAEILERQILDCLMIDALPWPTPLAAGGGTRLEVVDIGSGAGLPGLIVALRHPDFQVTSLERTGKKASFQQEAARQLGLTNVMIVQDDARKHASGPGRGHYQVALARGFADLTATLPLAADLLGPGGVLRTFKGRKLPDEMAAVPPAVRRLFAANAVELPYHVPGTSVAGVLVQFTRL